MIFTSTVFAAFLAVVLCTYWAVPRRRLQNGLLLGSSYIFYGWVHPWFCGLMAASTVFDWMVALAIERWPAHRRPLLVASVVANLGLLGGFKYFDFFAESVQRVLSAFGLEVTPIALHLMLPVGISFYTFQSLSYVIDVYRGELAARRSLADFALYVAFFPQLVAGPIERAQRLLPQIEAPRRFRAAVIASALPLFVRGYLKKLVVADNVAVFADQVFLLEHPPLLLLAAGTLAFAVQIYADFSGYTDIARGSARLLGFELIENFRAPFLALSPSDYWRRWHISLSSWIRDYLYIPLGGSRVGSRARFLFVSLATFGLSGLWHGAAWHFVAWGLYHGALLFAYHGLGMGSRWRPRGRARTLLAWCAMSAFTLVGWALFRAPSLGWLAAALAAPVAGLSGDTGVASAVIVAFAALYALPLALLAACERSRAPWLSPLAAGLCVALVLLFHRDAGQDFIYFRF